MTCDWCDVPYTGNPIEITMPDGKTYKFCCVACLKKWVESKGKK